MTTGPLNPNLDRLAYIAGKLALLLDKIVFVGGCVTELLLTDPAAAPVRPTLDVDAITSIASYAEFTMLERRLRDLGFRNCPKEGAPICRWLYDNLILDLMPTDASILGFTNTWYGPALEHAKIIKIAWIEIRVITAPYFVATKLAAFHSRGKNDFRMSHDLEDIITVVEGRAELLDEVGSGDADLKRYLGDEFRSLLSNRNFMDALPGHLLPDAASQQRISIVIERLRRIIDLI